MRNKSLQIKLNQILALYLISFGGLGMMVFVSNILSQGALFSSGVEVLVPILLALLVIVAGLGLVSANRYLGFVLGGFLAVVCLYCLFHNIHSGYGIISVASAVCTFACILHLSSLIHAFRGEIKSSLVTKKHNGRNVVYLTEIVDAPVTEQAAA